MIGGGGGGGKRSCCSGHDGSTQVAMPSGRAVSFTNRLELFDESAHEHEHADQLPSGNRTGDGQGKDCL